MLQSLFSYARPYRNGFVWGSLISVSGYAVWLIIPWIMGEIITFAAEYRLGESAREAWQYLGIIAITALYYYSTVEIGRGMLRWIAEKISLDIQKHLLRHISSLNLLWHEKENTGSKLKKINRGGESMSRMLKMYTDLGIDVFVSLVGIPIVFAVLSWELNILVVLFFVVHYLLSNWLTLRAMGQSRLVNEEEADYHGRQFELLNHIATIKTMNMQGRIMGWLEGHINSLAVAIRKRIILFRTRLGILGFERQLFRLAIIGFSVWKVTEGEFEVGMIAQVYFYFGKIEVTADRITSLSHQWSLTKVDMESINEILAEVPHIEQSGSQDFDLAWNQLRIDQLTFGFGEREILSGLSFSIKKGEKIGIAGGSGAGKSTLIRLLLKLYDGYSGKISFDQTELSELKRSSYIRHVGVVLQDTELFNLSIKDNILMAVADEEVDENRLKRVIEMARLSDLMEKLPTGWDTMIGEKGLKLSGGEKQRLGLARALYRQPSILILDEATSHLDNQSEAQIQAALDDALVGITAIVIAHRLSTLTKMDRILVLNEGQVVQEGNFEELTVREGVFREMWEEGKM